MGFENGDFIHDRRATFEEAEKLKILSKDDTLPHNYTGGFGCYYVINDTGGTSHIPYSMAMSWSDFEKIEFKFKIGDAVCTNDTQKGFATKWEVTSIHPAYEKNARGVYDHRYYCKGPDKDYGTCGMYETQMVDWYKHNGKHRPSTPKFKKDDWVCLELNDKNGFADKRRVDMIHIGDGVNAHRYEIVDVDGVRSVHYQNEIIFWNDRTHKSIPHIEVDISTTIAQDAQSILELSSKLESMVVTLENRLLNRGVKLPQFYHLVRHESSQLTRLIQEIWNHNNLNIEENNDSVNS